MGALGYFSYKNIYVEDNKRILEVNVLPEKCCNFDCVFCPIGRSASKTDMQKSFNGTENSLIELEKKINELSPGLIFINSKGEALLNDKIGDIIDFIEDKGLPIRLFTNGYLLGKDEYMKIADKCDEVVGELKAVSEEDFQKLQRPLEGYTLAEYISNMSAFKKQYNGKFILEITIIRGCNDDEESVEKLKYAIKQISPDLVSVTTINDERFKKKLGVTDETLERISKELLKL